MAASLTEVIIDCEDPGRIAKFWSDVLGWTSTEEKEHGIWWASATGGYDARPFLVFVPVPEKKTLKNRIHLDVSPKDCDQAEELERLLLLGATRLDKEGEFPWIVLADPEGNEFCLLGRRGD